MSAITKSVDEENAEPVPIRYAIGVRADVGDKINAVYQEITHRAGDDAADVWRAGLYAHLVTLAINPERKPLAFDARPEIDNGLCQTIRQTVYRAANDEAAHRILFAVIKREKKPFVLALDIRSLR